MAAHVAILASRERLLNTLADSVGFGKLGQQLGKDNSALVCFGRQKLLNKRVNDRVSRELTQ